MAQKKSRQPQIIFVGFCMLILGVIWLFFINPTSNSSTLNNSRISQERYSQQANEILKENQIPTPLILQTDERWAHDNYGSGDNNTLAQNGCAILSLTMILSYFEKNEAMPQDILNWAHNNYFVADQGTSWQIFSDFANHYHLQYHDLGNDFQRARQYLQQKIPVVVSVKPGRFTDVGHIMVLGAETNNQILILDPNDTPAKTVYKELFHAEDITREAIHYWAFTKS